MQHFKKGKFYFAEKIYELMHEWGYLLHDNQLIFFKINKLLLTVTFLRQHLFLSSDKIQKLKSTTESSFQHINVTYIAFLMLHISHH